MTEYEASRTLVKSAPELWAECSEASSLSRHLDQFGEIRITRLEPETAVAWEGERVSGTVRLEPSGWGTRVLLTVRGSKEPRTTQERPERPERPAPPSPVPERPAPHPEPPQEPEPLPPAAGTRRAPPQRRSRRGRFARLKSLLWGRPQAPPEPDHSELTRPADPHLRATALAPDPRVEAREAENALPPDSRPAHEFPDAVDSDAVLVAALESLGQAHHRPYSRA